MMKNKDIKSTIMLIDCTPNGLKIKNIFIFNKGDTYYILL